MLGILLTSLAFAQSPADINAEVEPEATEEVAKLGELRFDARLPAEIRVDNQTVAQLYMGARLSIKAKVGSHEVLVLTNGTPRRATVYVPDTGAATVLVGRTGLTTGMDTASPEDDDGNATVEFRVAGARDVMVQVDGDRFRIDGNGVKGLMLPVGTHSMSVRSGNGTVVWASGRLEIKRAGDVIVQLAEGRMPEVSGQGSKFFPGG